MDVASAIRFTLKIMAGQGFVSKLIQITSIYSIETEPAFNVEVRMLFVSHVGHHQDGTDHKHDVTDRGQRL